MCHLLQLVVLRRLQGRLAEMEPAAREAAEDYATSYPLCRCAHIHVLAALGREDEARAGLAALAPEGFGGLDFDETWLGAMAFLAEAVHVLGAAEQAETLYDLLAPYADRVAVSTPEVALATVPRYLGLLAAVFRAGRAGRGALRGRGASRHASRAPARSPPSRSSDHAALTGDPALASRAVDECGVLGMEVIAGRAAAVLA